MPQRGASGQYQEVVSFSVGDAWDRGAPLSLTFHMSRPWETACQPMGLVNRGGAPLCAHIIALGACEFL